MGTDFRNVLNKKAGFTLVELMVVISIISLLSSIFLTTFNRARDKARIASGMQFAASIYHALGSEMIGQWNFEDVANPGYDSSGNNRHGTPSTSARLDTDTYDTSSGHSAFFNGSSYVIVNNAPAAKDIKTISFWVKFNTLTSDSIHCE